MKCPKCGLGEGDMIRIRRYPFGSRVGRIETMSRSSFRDIFQFHFTEISPDGKEVRQSGVYYCACKSDTAWKKERISVQLELFGDQK